jgi:hypothetical protein
VNRLQNLAAALVEAQEMPLRKAAPYLASNGWPIYPCTPGGKVPLTGHGLTDATTDAQQVERWWSQWPTANIAVATGTKSGFDVVDVDLREKRSGYPAFHNATERFGLEKWMIRVLTPSGGMHYFHPSPEHRVQRNWVCGDAAIDFRGAGGAVILPPSVGACGHDLEAPYTLIETQPKGRPIDSAGLREFLDPMIAQRRFAGVLRRNTKDPRPQLLANWVAARPEGSRNSCLFWAACRLVEGGLAIGEAIDVLLPAAELSGLVEAEITATIRSAYRHTQPLPQPVPVPMGVQMVRSR